MGSKNNPGKFDCYANADPDEPMFILLGRDPVAGPLIGLWIFIRISIGANQESDPEIVEARQSQVAANVFAAAKGKGLVRDKVSLITRRWLTKRQ